MRTIRRRIISIAWAVVVVGVLAFGAREALASAGMESCEDCVPGVTNCMRCCIDWGWEGGICPGSGGGYCLCY
jgi:hypothetical protein